MCGKLVINGLQIIMQKKRVWHLIIKHHFCMMKFCLLLSLAICCLFSCRAKNNSGSPSIKGEWEEWSEKSFTKPRRLLSFEDSMCSSFFPSGDYMHYSISK